jgi:hypothetical protein
MCFRSAMLGGDPPMITNDAGKKILRDVAARIFPDQPPPKDTKINPNWAAEMIDMFNKTRWPNLDEDLCIRIFFMVLNNNFLTPNTYCYIRPVDALWCRDMSAIAGYNWCKIIYDNTREAGRKCRWLDISEWIDRLYRVVHYSSWYELDISAIHVHILFYN